ncbi:hypothetical protein H8S90_13375 [Olivibacter sp. SDN3]|uniref:hypothetical protein n=1 Tax=Olivibacter sp. SDN3 TaxID=2764720 RepID=UPI001651450A|nr:hypothetical protein [Olivibacter sp. SDN3]QNL47811.1 hypothetical protein H8S90_13375 [Olivibacter sp. SDN3]
MTLHAKNKELAICLKLIEQKLAWGSGEDWATDDFEKLSDLIRAETKVHLSVSTLKRLWGRVRYESTPTRTTLNALTCFLGYQNWHVFRQHIQQSTAEMSNTEEEEDSIPKLERAESSVAKYRWWIVSVSVLVALFGATLFLVQFSPKNPASKEFKFSSKPVTTGIPNSVVFSYDAKAAGIEPVYIQQSWDSTRRVSVDKNGTYHTAIYYEPGFYQAKLVVGSQIIKEHPLIVPTEGWLATISTETVPIYLEQKSYLRSDELHLPIDTIISQGIKMQPQAPVIKYFNVGNFEAIGLNDFSFSTRVKNTYGGGNSACQFSSIILLTDGMPISIPLSQKGCVSELSLLDGERVISGKENDLSSFGIATDDWIEVACKSSAGKMIDYYINGALVYRSVLPAQKLKILGLIYAFRGAGAIKEVQLADSKRVVFKAFPA